MSTSAKTAAAPFPDFRDGQPQSLPAPSDLYGGLLEEVQMRRLFADGKTFVDAVPASPVEDIVAAFRHADRQDSALRAFVAEHFTLPAAADVHDPRQSDDLRHYIASLWPDLIRCALDVPPGGSMLSIAHPYVVPGGRFTELYYWDSYFTLLGLVRDGHEALARSMVDAFTQLIERFGFIPNGTRTYYLSRSQPPLFFAMLELLPDPDPAVQRRRLGAMIAEHAFWMRGSGGLIAGGARDRVVAMPDGALLNRYWDDRDTPRDESYAEDVTTAMASGRPAGAVFRALRAAAESGWDFSSRWLADDGELGSIITQQIVPADLNAFLYGLETAIRRLAEDLCEDGLARRYRTTARQRRGAMQRWLWSSNGYFADYDLGAARQSAQPSAATLAPLFTGVATKMQAGRVARTVASTLLAPGGLRTTTVETGEQWDHPNGWAPLQWIAFRGLRRYGHVALADAIAARWVQMVDAEFQHSGAVHEKYDVEKGGRGHGGEYVPQIGFGWTNGVTAAFIDLLHWRGLLQARASHQTRADEVA